MVPGKPDPVTTAVISTNIQISWTKPEHFGSEITSYKVLILAADGVSLVDDGTFCSSVTGLQCTIPMDTLTDPAGLFQLPLNAPIQATVRAVNGLGAGPYSDLNTDESYDGVAYAKTIPDTPTLPPIRFESTTTVSLITVEMPEIVSGSDEAGGADITSYNLEWNEGSGTTFTEVIGESVDNADRAVPVVTTPGDTYLFRYRVKNIYGFSTGYSPVASFLSAKAPEPPAVVIT